MNDATVTILYKDLWKAAAKDDSRPILTCINVSPDEKAVAADGFMLAVVPCRITGTLEAPINIPASFYRLATQYKATQFVIRDNVIRAKIAMGWLECESFKGTFPDWRKLIGEYITAGEEYEPDGLAIDPARVAAIAAAIDASTPVMLRAGPKRTDLTYIKAGDALGVIMPMSTSMDWAEDLKKAIA